MSDDRSKVAVLRGRIANYSKTRADVTFMSVQNRSAMEGVAIGAAAAGLGAQALGAAMASSSSADTVDALTFDLNGQQVNTWLWSSPFGDDDEVVVVGVRDEEEGKFQAQAIVRPADRLMALSPHVSRGRKAHVRNAMKWWGWFNLFILIFYFALSRSMSTYIPVSDALMFGWLPFSLIGLLITWDLIRRWMPFVHTAEAVFKALGWPNVENIDMPKWANAQRIDLDGGPGAYGVYYFRYPPGLSVCGQPDSSLQIDRHSLRVIEGEVGELCIADEKSSLWTQVRRTRAGPVLSSPQACATKGAASMMSSLDASKSVGCFIGEQWVLGELSATTFRNGDMVRAVVSDIDGVGAHLRALVRSSDASLWLPTDGTRGRLSLAWYLFTLIGRGGGLLGLVIAGLLAIVDAGHAAQVVAWLSAVGWLVCFVVTYPVYRKQSQAAERVFQALGLKYPSRVCVKPDVPLATDEYVPGVTQLRYVAPQTMRVVEGVVSELCMTRHKTSFLDTLCQTRASEILNLPHAGATRGLVQKISTRTYPRGLGCFIGKQWVVGEQLNPSFQDGDTVRAVISDLDSMGAQVHAVFSPSDGALWLTEDHEFGRWPLRWRMLVRKGYVGMAGMVVAGGLAWAGYSTTAEPIAWFSAATWLALSAWGYLRRIATARTAEQVFTSLGFKHPSRVVMKPYSQAALRKRAGKAHGAPDVYHLPTALNALGRRG